MYPGAYFDLFPPFPRSNRVFVAMSFHPSFDARWSNVIAPAIASVRIGQHSLQPNRVDARQISNSILTEILDGIGNDRLFFADVTALGELDGRTVRNENVLYEVGLAHAVRLPEEVVLFRSDDAPLLFDLANIRVNRYSPDSDPGDSRQNVVQALVDALNELDLKRHLAVRSASQALDYRAFLTLAMAASADKIHHRPTRTMGEALGNASFNQSIIRLLELGALEASVTPITPELFKSASSQPGEQLVPYRPTPFGRAILDHALNEMRLFDSSVEALLRSFLQPESGDAAESHP